MKQLDLLEGVNTISLEDIPNGIAILRPHGANPKDIFLTVAPCGQIRMQSKDKRTRLIVNLRTGTIFACFEREQVILLPHAAVISNTKGA